MPNGPTCSTCPACVFSNAEPGEAKCYIDPPAHVRGIVGEIVDAWPERPRVNAAEDWCCRHPLRITAMEPPDGLVLDPTFAQKLVDQAIDHLYEETKRALGDLPRGQEGDQPPTPETPDSPEEAPRRYSSFSMGALVRTFDRMVSVWGVNMGDGDVFITPNTAVGVRAWDVFCLFEEIVLRLRMKYAPESEAPARGSEPDGGALER